MEIRKDRIMPDIKAMLIAADYEGVASWLVYIDGVDIDEFCLAAASMGLVHGEPGNYQQHVRAILKSLAIARSEKKAEVREPAALRLGVWIDPAAGFLCLEASRIQKLISFTLDCIGMDCWSRKRAQILGGLWVFGF
jgi:hypothetical protein